MAIAIVNRGRAGITIDEEKMKESFSSNAVKIFFDPNMAENRAVYESIQVKENHNIWLPSVAYIEHLKKAGQIGTRPDWMNAGIDIANGVMGFTVGLFEGFFGGIWDILQDMVDMVKNILSVIGQLFTGELFSKAQELYEEVKGFVDSISKMSAEQIKNYLQSILQELISGVVDAAKDFWGQLTHPNMYTRWHTWGKLIGQIVLEVLLAIFTAGSGNAAKWALKLQKVFPKLAKILGKFVSKASKLKGKGFKGDRDGILKDEKGSPISGEKVRAVVAAKLLVEGAEQRGQSLEEIKVILLGLKNKYPVIRRFEYESVGTNTTIYLIASKIPIAVVKSIRRHKEKEAKRERASRIKKPTYENPGHHDPQWQRKDKPHKYNPSKSVLPANHRELWDKSVPVPNAEGKISWYSIEIVDGKKVYHRFQVGEAGKYHWNGSTNAKLQNGTPRIWEVESDLRKAIEEAWKKEHGEILD